MGYDRLEKKIVSMFLSLILPGLHIYFTTCGLEETLESMEGSVKVRSLCFVICAVLRIKFALPSL